MGEDSISLHFKLSDPAAYGLADQKPAYGDISTKARKEQCRRAADLLDKLHQFDRDLLSSDQQLTYDIFEEKLKETVSLEDYLLFPTLLGSNGLPSQIPVSLSEYYFNTETDVRNYLALLSQLPALFDQLLIYEKEREDAGYKTPSFVIRDTISQIDQFLAGSDEDNLLINTFHDRIASVPGISEDQKKSYISNNQALFTQLVLPAYQSLKESLTLMSEEMAGSDQESKRKPDSDEQPERICQYEKGQDYYRLLLKSGTGTGRTPEEWIRLLETRLKESVDHIAQLNSDYPDLYSEYLAAEPELTDPDQILNQLKEDILIDFPETEDTGYTLKALPASLMGTSASAFYLLPPIDSQPDNIIYVNQNRLDSQDLFSTLAHEAFPGHLYQTNYYMNQKPDPLRLLLRTAGYDEGWGTYAQLYSYNYIEFKNVDKETTDILRQLYRDNDLMALTMSSLSDLYVNYMNYDRKALAECLKPYGISEENASSIYEYVVENPTTYLNYCIGYYELEELLAESKKKLGADFDLQTWHQAVLDAGSCPFPILKEYLEAGE